MGIVRYSIPLVVPAAATVVCLAALAAPASAAPAIYELGTFISPSSNGYAINEAGAVAGYCYNTNQSAARAFRYDGTPGAGGVMRDLGTLGGTSSIGYGVNASGQVVGRAQAISNIFHAFRYDGTPGAGGAMRDLGTLGNFSLTSRADAINNAGQAVGQSRTTSATDHAFLYTGTPGAGGIMQDLGTLGGFNSAAQGINNAGQIVGYSNPVGNNIIHAFLYEGIPGAGGTMHDLGTLPGGSISNATAINDIGQVVGFADTTGNGLPTDAFRYDPLPGGGGIMRDLGSLNGGYQTSAHDVNNLGIVVGESDTADSIGREAFLYTGTPGAGGQMINLNAWLDANNPAEGPKWYLVSAQAITDTGWITGFGSYDPDGPGDLAAVGRAFLLDGSSLVPEPGALSVLTVAAAVSLVPRRRRR